MYFSCASLSHISTILSCRRSSRRASFRLCDFKSKLYFMRPHKRPRIESQDAVASKLGEESVSWRNKFLSELENVQTEVEAIEIKKSTGLKNESISYRPTYRAVLAKRGYLVGETLGSGSYSKVKLVYNHGKQMDKSAVKIIDRHKAPKDFQTRFLPREIEIWPKLCHPNIIRMQDIFEDYQRVYMILEFADHGDVLRYIQKSGALNEPLAKSWALQVCDAVRYLHEQNITHRDLKLENLLLDSTYSIKICDFGFVKNNTMQELSSTYCGSKSYAAPEILKGEPYEPKKADIWAIGVIVYIFVTGKMPYDESKGNHSVLEEHTKLNFPWHKFLKVTEVCKQLILWLFRFDFPNRPDIHSVLRDEWFTSNTNIDKNEDVGMEGSKIAVEKVMTDAAQN